MTEIKHQPYRERPDPQITMLVARIRARELRLAAEMLYEFGDQEFAKSAEFLRTRADQIEREAAAGAQE